MKYIPPKTVAIIQINVLRWLYPDIMRVMRERYNTRFILIGAGDAISPNWLGPNDEFIDINQIHEIDILSNIKDRNADNILSETRNNEIKYNFLMWRDLVQRDRSISTKMLDIANNTFFSYLPLPDELEVAFRVNHYLFYFERLFESQKVDLFISLGLSVMEGCAQAVARNSGIAITLPGSARKGGLMFWATDDLIGDSLHRSAYEQTPDQPLIALEDLVTPDGPRQRLKTLERQFSVASVARQTAGAIVSRIVWGFRSLRNFEWYSRPSITREIILIFKSRQTFKKVIGMSHESIEFLSSKPFIFFPLAQEPEFTVQVRNREWNDQFGIIKLIALCLPPGYRLVIKEHSIVGRQAPERFEAILRLPNVVMAHPGIPGVELVRRANGVVSLGGTASLEAAFAGKRSVIFSDHSEYGFLPSVRKVSAPKELPEAVRELLDDISEEESGQYRMAAARFYAALDQISFDASGTAYFGFGDGKLDEEQLDRAVDLLCKSYSLQKAYG